MGPTFDLQPPNVEASLLELPLADAPLNDFTSNKKTSKVMRSRLRRRERIQSVADAAVEKWVKKRSAEGAAIGRRLPSPWRFRYQRNGGVHAMPPPYRELVFKAGLLKTIARLRLWLWGALRFARGWFLLWLFRKNTDENRARLLRETLTMMGPTFIKLGQQLSMRLDLLPYAYTNELEKLLDELDAFDSETALQIVERAVGRNKGVAQVSRAEIFSAFDETSIGAASVACVFHAVDRKSTRLNSSH